MSHARAAIRTALTAALTGLTTTGANVFTEFDQPAAQSAVPCLVINVASESVEYEGGASMGASASANRIEREIELHVQGYAKTDAELDTIAEEVEAAMHTPGNFSTVSSIDIKTGDQAVTFDNDGDFVVGMIDLVFLISYRTAENDPATLI